MNRTAEVIGLDIAKNVFVAVGISGQGKMLFKKKLARDEVLSWFGNHAVARVGIEACAGSHYWARELNKLGHDARLIAAQHVKPFVSGSKNDANDAAAIAEVRSRQSTHYVPINTDEQEDIQMLHRAREGLMKERRALICRIRNFAAEKGVVFPLGVAKFREGIHRWLDEENNNLSGLAKQLYRDLLEQLCDKDKRLDEYDCQLSRLARENDKARQLQEVPGVGKMVATAVLATVGAAHYFENSRDFSANLGLVPRQHSSGGKERLLGITKRGDRYLRTLLIHGARSAIRAAGNKPDRMLRWALKVQERRGTKVAAVALANKMARVIWAMLNTGKPYAVSGVPA